MAIRAMTIAMAARDRRRATMSFRACIQSLPPHALCWLADLEVGALRTLDAVRRAPNRFPVAARLRQCLRRFDAYRDLPHCRGLDRLACPPAVGVRDREGGLVVAHPLVDVARVGLAGGLAVAEVPVVGDAAGV